MERLRVRGWVRLKKNGLLVYKGPNLVVDAGEALIAELIMDTSAAKVGWMAMGDDGTTPAAGQTALQGSEHERVAVSDLRVANTMTYTGVFGAGLGGTVLVEEFGLFNDAVVGTMLARFTCSQLEVSSTDVIQAVWALTIGD